jgi:hypothetical protein
MKREVSQTKNKFLKVGATYYGTLRCNKYLKIATTSLKID